MVKWKGKTCSLIASGFSILLLSHHIVVQNAEGLPPTSSTMVNDIVSGKRVKVKVKSSRLGARASSTLEKVTDKKIYSKIKWIYGEEATSENPGENCHEACFSLGPEAKCSTSHMSSVIDEATFLRANDVAVNGKDLTMMNCDFGGVFDINGPLFGFRSESDNPSGVNFCSYLDRTTLASCSARPSQIYTSDIFIQRLCACALPADSGRVVL